MATFIVRLETDDAGRVVGVVEHVRSREKERVRSVEAITGAITRMLGSRPRGVEGSGGTHE